MTFSIQAVEFSRDLNGEFHVKTNDTFALRLRYSTSTKTTPMLVLQLEAIVCSGSSCSPLL